MIVSFPKEIKDRENRISLTPAGCQSLTQQGHKVLIEADAGLGSGFGNEEYQKNGATVIASAGDLWNQAQMVVKVKEPLEPEYQYFRKDLVLFTFLHLADNPKLTDHLLSSKITSISYETVQLPDGRLPLLTPMSEVAGRIAVQIGAHLLEKIDNGRGILLGGVTNVDPAQVVIIGGGVVGTNSAQIAVGMGAQVTIIDKNAQRLEQLQILFNHRIKTLSSTAAHIAEAVKAADLLIGGVLVMGDKCPKLVTENMVKTMKPGAVIVDVAIDHGGCIETVDRTTSHSHPTYEKYGVVHYAVPNMPGIVPRTSTLALTHATLPYVLALANLGFPKALEGNEPLAKGVNTLGGHCTCAAVCKALGLKYTPLESLLPLK